MTSVSGSELIHMRFLQYKDLTFALNSNRTHPDKKTKRNTETSIDSGMSNQIYARGCRGVVARAAHVHVCSIHGLNSAECTNAVINTDILRHQTRHRGLVHVCMYVCMHVCVSVYTVRLGGVMVRHTVSRHPEPEIQLSLPLLASLHLQTESYG
jgi:hypothetical protein